MANDLFGCRLSQLHLLSFLLNVKGTEKEEKEPDRVHIKNILTTGHCWQSSKKHFLLISSLHIIDTNSNQDSALLGAMHALLKSSPSRSTPIFLIVPSKKKLGLLWYGSFFANPAEPEPLVIIAAISRCLRTIAPCQGSMPALSGFMKSIIFPSLRIKIALAHVEFWHLSDLP